MARGVAGECEGARDGIDVCLGIQTGVYVFRMCVYLCVRVCNCRQPPFQRFQFFSSRFFFLHFVCCVHIWRGGSRGSARGRGTVLTCV